MDDPRLLEIASSLLTGMKDSGYKLEKNQRASNFSQYYALNRLLGSAHAVFSQDLEGRINFANKPAAEFFGYTVDEFVGIPSLKLIPDDKEVMKQREELVNRVLNTGEYHEFFNIKRIGRNDKEIIVPHWIAFRYSLGGEYSLGSVIPRD